MNDFESLIFSRRAWFQSALLASAFPLAAWGDAKFPDNQDDEEDEDNPNRFKTKLQTTFIGDKTTFAGLEPIILEGVGLVRGLAGTGGDPHPSQYRTALMEHLKKEGYKNPNAILASPDTALVLVRAYLQPTVKIGDRLDVDVIIPPQADATSLVGGELMEVRLSDRAFVDGRYMEGKLYAKARGPVLPAGLGASANKEPALLKQGRVLGGAVVVRERELSLYLKNDFRAIRNAKRVSDVIGQRFHDFDEHGIKKAMANPKTDQRLVLKVHPKYKDNYLRYLQVIRHMAFTETPVELRLRMNQLKKDLAVPELASSSSLQLEAIGRDAIPILKSGLNAPTLECRFYAAVALAYLGDSSGLSALAEATKKERAFRAFSLAALATIEDAEVHIALRDLMNESNDETRYGSFRALWTIDRNDPFIRGETLGIRENAENHDSEYKLHVLKTSGPPLVHVTQRTRPEIVIFGADQEFSTPMYATAGKHIIVTAQPGATTAQLARFEVGKQDLKKEVPLRVADVIRAADELGATYPDILQLLADASQQKNLPTELAVEKRPEAGRPYYRPTSEGEPKKSRPVRIGKDSLSPNIFPSTYDPTDQARRKEESDRETNNDKEEGNGTMASVPSESVSTSDDTDSKSKKKKDAPSKKSDKSKRSWFGGSK